MLLLVLLIGLCFEFKDLVNLFLEMYDPEEACEENENSVDNSGLEDLLSTDEIIKSDFDIEEKIEIQVEDVEVKPVVRTPITRRNQGAVRNGAGPKTRTKRGGK